MPEETDQLAALALQALDSLEDMGDEEEQRETFAYLARAVNEDRLSERPRFGSCGSSSSIRASYRRSGKAERDRTDSRGQQVEERRLRFRLPRVCGKLFLEVMECP